RATITRHGLRPADVEAALAGWLESQPGIQAAYTRTRLLEGLPAGDAVGQQVLRSFHPERSGDVTVVNQPFWIMWSLPTGTTHGRPQEYDTPVPLRVFGPGIPPGAYADPITPQAAAVLLAHSLRIRPPAAADAAVPEQITALHR